MKDLGVIFESNFEFKKHLDIAVSRSFKLLGFIKRSIKEFRDVHAILNLYKTILKPVLSYGSIIWTPHYSIDLQTLESVQHRLFRYIAFKLGRPIEFDLKAEIALELELWSIKSEHVYYDMMFIKKAKGNLH